MPTALRRIQLSERAARVLLALVASALLALPAQLAHFLLVRHVVCAEHGELVHAGPGAERPAARVGAERRTPGVALRAAAVGHEHEHCAFASAARDGLAVGRQRAIVAAAALPVAALSSARPLLQGPRVVLFRLAPKTSPPA
jgi:hypothetical protein